MKKYFLGLLFGFVGFISFGYCDLISPTSYNYINNSTSPMSFNCGGFCCFWQSSSNTSQRGSFTIVYGDKTDGFGSNINNLVCMSYNGQINVSTTNSTNLGFGFYDLTSIISSCPEINTGEILSGYILESEIDTNYCVGNGLCPNECGSGSDLSGDLQYSNIYINSILHPGRQNIFIDIPDYITWDYSLTGDDFNLYVGSGYDMDYMNSIIKINSYRPDSQDFTNIFVSGLTLVFPYIAILLLIVFMWKLLKRIFK